MHPRLDAFETALKETAVRLDAALDGFLPGPEGQLGAAMRHAVLGGGKRLRGFLAIECAGLFRVPAGHALRTAAAVECVHAYSLVHDDLPCMDDDRLRRGQPTVHVKWDEATAVLAGDALQALAFGILSSPKAGIDPRIQMRLVSRLAEAAGADGMVGGQVLDLAAESMAGQLTVEDIAALQDLKTGALIVWAAESGAHLGRSDVEPLRRYAADLGLAFQVQDDILDVEGDPEAAGKALRKDEDAGKATFVSLLGVEGARDKARDLAARACDSLAPYGSAADRLRGAAEFAVTRGG